MALNRQPLQQQSPRPTPLGQIAGQGLKFERDKRLLALTL
jgi:hypothetical protein